jgi:hypothetical protein
MTMHWPTQVPTAERFSIGTSIDRGPEFSQGLCTSIHLEHQTQVRSRVSRQAPLSWKLSHGGFLMPLRILERDGLWFSFLARAMSRLTRLRPNFGALTTHGPITRFEAQRIGGIKLENQPTFSVTDGLGTRSGGKCGEGSRLFVGRRILGS